MEKKGLSNFLGMISRLYGDYKPQIIFLAVLGFLSGGFEALGVSMVIPIFSRASGAFAEKNEITALFDKLFYFLGFEPSLNFLLILITVFFILRACILFIFEFLRMKISVDYEKNTRITLYKEFLYARWSYLLRQKIGHLENTLMVDVGVATNFLSLLTNSILNVASLSVYLVVAFSISFYMTMFALFVGGVLIFLFKPLIAKNRLYSHDMVLLNKSIAHDINENIVGSKTIKSLNAEKSMANFVSTLFLKLRIIKIKQALVKSFTNSTVEPVSLIIIVVIFALSYSRSGFNFAVFAVLLYMIQRIFVYVGRAQVSLHGLVGSVPYAERALLLKDELLHEKEINNGNKSFLFEKELSFKNVSFGYIDSKSVIEKMDFSLKKGEMLGVVGFSGAGKTTVADLVLRFFDPLTGKIFLDDIDIREINLVDWRKNIGYVTQDMFLLNDTIENNIKFYETNVSRKDYDRAVNLAYVMDFAKNFPEGLKTTVGERGLQLSVGQRQRVALARVLARHPKILVLDEATSSLDNESESLIKGSIESLKGKITLLVIAHRLSTVLNCDRILVLRDGKIVESDSPKNLLENNDSHFYRLYHSK